MNCKSVSATSMVFPAVHLVLNQQPLGEQTALGFCSVSNVKIRLRLSLLCLFVIIRINSPKQLVFFSLLCGCCKLWQ